MLMCARCPLHKYRSHVVIGRGDPKTARILIIGEAPGVSEDVLSKAFIGEAGKMLDDILLHAGVPQGICFFTNTILCRPCDYRSGPNRAPTKAEALACMPNVSSIISNMKKIDCIIFAGRVAETYYASRTRGIKSFYMTHPSAIIKHGGKASSQYWDAINLLKKELKCIL